LEERKKRYLKELDDLEYQHFSSDDNMDYGSETKSENAFKFGEDDENQEYDDMENPNRESDEEEDVFQTNQNQVHPIKGNKSEGI
jgi:hypothetical protein